MGHGASDLSPEERAEVRELYLRLHYLYPDRGHDRHARERLPPGYGTEDLYALRHEVRAEERRSAACDAGPPRSQEQRMSDQLDQLEEDHRRIENGEHPDDLYARYFNHINLEHSPLQRWVSRRSQLEKELDNAARDAEAGLYELEGKEKEMVEALKRLRNAEAIAREHGLSALDEDD